MTPDTLRKAQNLQDQIRQVHLDAQEFKTCLNLAAMRSKSDHRFDAHELAKGLKTIVELWEAKHTQQLQKIYDNL
ncbi:hypothetical protein P1X15_30970 [Runella sp. MFBS21]|uniref:hypothetical protein n=1 Tax=Runella sp. MFBS21 TaxID=3034018 RepID=UPI0023F891DD|nr:hypothetical protein [Runella sp. MFBS21]MDF7822079.1 hypothetical protein [Runella sp. MFBS21]